MKAIDPDYQCQKYFSRGPNWAWHIDGFDKLKSYGFPIHGCIDRYSRGILVLTKETTYDEQETTWNNPKQLRHNLQWPEHTYNEQRKDVKQPTTRKISDYFTIWGKRFSSLTRFPPNIWLQSFEHCFMVKMKQCFMVKTECQASVIIRQASIIMCIFCGI